MPVTKLFFSLCFFLLVSHWSYSQVKVEAQATGKHAKVFNEAKQRHAQAKTIKKKQKQLKRAYKLHRTRYDSLRAIQLDSLGESVISKEDSLAISSRVLEETHFPPEYKQLIFDSVLPDPISKEEIDSVIVAKGITVAEQIAEENMPGELEALDDPGGNFKNPSEVPGQLTFTKPSKPNPNLIKPEAATALFEKIDSEQFKDAQLQIQKLKKKYSDLQDTRYPEEGTKRNSLEDIPFLKRVYTGGTISIPSTDPLILNVSLQLGYRFNKKWLAGVGLILREQFTMKDSLPSGVSGDGYGYSVFTRYDIFKSFFAWAESEWQMERSLFRSEQERPKHWQKAFLLGVGREFKIGIVQMMTVIMYDFNYQQNSINQRPWVFRMGMRFSKGPDKPG